MLLFIKEFYLDFHTPKQHCKQALVLTLSLAFLCAVWFIWDLNTLMPLKTQVSEIQSKIDSQKKPASKNHAKNTLVNNPLTLLNQIGQALTEKVALLQIDIDPNTRQIRIRMSAKSLHDLLAFNEHLRIVTKQKITLEKHELRADASEWPIEAFLRVGGK